MKAWCKAVWPLALAAALFAGGCSNDDGDVLGGGETEIVGNGVVISESRPVNGVFGVRLESIGTLHVEQGSSETLRVEADENILPYIVTAMSGATLEIRTEPGFELIPTRIDFYLTVVDLDRIELAGLGRIEVADLVTSALNLENTGAGEIDLSNLTANELSVNHSGLAQIRVKGQVNGQNVELTGLGDYEAGELASSEVEVLITGAGSVTVRVSLSLTATITGTGSVYYYGDPPTIDFTDSGTGELVHLSD
jgi:hypothetical protein